MASREAPGWWKDTVNPFPRSAVAVRSARRPSAPTIETAAVKEVRRVVDEYAEETLRSNTGSLGGNQLPDDGRVIVIHGEFGTGKTHLLLDALHRVAKARDRGLDARVFYRVPTGGSFLPLYKDIMLNEVGAYSMRKRVLEFYAEIVAHELRGHPFRDLLVGQLESDKSDPQLVISKYGLREGALLAQLRKRLGAVTNDEMYAQALMLFLQPELQELIWGWFTGAIPGRTLRSHGLTEAIDSDSRALEALGVVARVYRRDGRRFVLAIDEMEKLVGSWTGRNQAKILEFGKLLEIFRRTGGLLIAAGLPDILEIIPPGKGRVEDEIVPSRLNDEDVRWYIRESIERRFPGKTDSPFTDKGAACVAYLSNGLAREVVRLCYYSYQAASENGNPIGELAVRSVSAARSRMDVGDRVRQRVREILDEQARDSHEGWVFDGIPEVTVDFWIPVDGRDVGCAVLISDSILDATQADVATALISSIRSPDSRRGVIQVVSGNLPADLRRKFEQALGTNPLILYNQQRFDQDFARALQAVVDSVSVSETEPYPGSAEMRLLRQETGRIARQQSTILRLLQDQEERLAGTVQQAHAGPSGEPEAGSRPETPEPGESPGLPPELAGMFGLAERSLTDYGDVRTFVQNTFGVAADERGATLVLASRMREGAAFGSVGVMTFLATVLDAFRSSVRGWLDSRGPDYGRAGAPTERDLEQLRGICETYQELYGVAPLFQLDQLPEITGLPGAAGKPDSRSERTRRAEALHEAFDRLGDRVYEAAVRAVGGGESEGQPSTLLAGPVSGEPGNQLLEEFRHLPVGLLDQRLDQRDAYQAVFAVPERHNVDGPPGHVEYQPGEPPAVDDVQQLGDPPVIDVDLPDDLVVSEPSDVRGHPREQLF